MAGPWPGMEASRVTARGRGRRAAAFLRGREGPARPGRPAGRGAAAPGRAGPQTMGAAAGGARRREQPGGGARERAPPAPAPRPLPCPSPPSSAGGSGAIPGPRFRAPGPRHGSLSAPIPGPCPRGPEGDRQRSGTQRGWPAPEPPPRRPRPRCPSASTEFAATRSAADTKAPGRAHRHLAAAVSAGPPGRGQSLPAKERRTRNRKGGQSCGGPGGARPVGGRDGCWGTGRGLGAPPFRSVFPPHGGVPPPTLQTAGGSWGGGGARAWRARDFPGPGAPAGALMIPGEPAEARDPACVWRWGERQCEDRSLEVLEGGGV